MYYHSGGCAEEAHRRFISSHDVLEEMAPKFGGEEMSNFVRYKKELS